MSAPPRDQVPVVRPATTADLPCVLRLLGEMYPEDPPLTEAEAARIWAEIETQAGRSLLVAEDVADEVLGTVDYVVMPNLSRGGQPRMVMENLVVSEAHRRRGAGRLLVDAVSGVAAREGCYKIMLFAAEDAYVHNFYRACGFEPCPDGFRRYL